MKIALLGAGGKMGARLASRLAGTSEHEVILVETGAGREVLERQGHACVPVEEAAAVADVVVFAVPDTVIGPLSESVVPLLKEGALVVLLDPAAPYANRLPLRDDVAYFVCHPAHPPLFPEDDEDFRREALEDHFGSGSARQSIVNALIQGEESAFALGESLARTFFGPILRSHRVSLQDMALLEPALSETVTATCLTVIREAYDEVVARGVPAAAARDFLLGHIQVELAVIFDFVPFTMSDGALQAIEEARSVMFRPDWRERVFDLDEVRASTVRITEPEQGEG